MLEVIAISGKKGTGKDWYAAKLRDWDPAFTVIVAFADPIKCRLYGQGHEDVLLAEKPIDTRHHLIETGKQEKKAYGEYFYARQLLALIRLYSSRGTRRVIISDLRFQVELFILEAHRDNGEFSLKLIRMEAPERNRLRIEREAKGDSERGALLAADISEVDLDELSKVPGRFEIIWNDLTAA